MKFGLVKIGETFSDSFLEYERNGLIVRLYGHGQRLPACEHIRRNRETDDDRARCFAPASILVSGMNGVSA